MTEPDVIRIVGDVIEINNEPFAKLMVPECRKHEFWDAVEKYFNSDGDYYDDE